MANGFSTRELRGRPVTAEEAAKSVQRLINSHFHNQDAAQCSIPARAEDDDLVASDWVEQSKERIRELEAQLETLDWTPITAENLPRLGDEVWGMVRAVHAVDRAYLGFIGNTADNWIQNRYTHRRALNAPSS